MYYCCGPNRVQMMTKFKYGSALCLVFWMAISGVYAQLEKVETRYGQLEHQNKQQPVTLRFVQADSNLVDDFARLSQIILIRHGEPALKKSGWKKRSEALQYIRDYDTVRVLPPSFIPLILSPGELTTIHSSSLHRAVSTSQQVFVQKELLRPDSLFREFERKIFAFPNVKLPLRFWLAGSRVLWFLGLNNRGIESLRVAKARAQKAAGILEQDSVRHGKTLLVAHGLFNRYLEKYLRKRGWTTVYNGGNAYLSQKMLVKYRP